MAKKTSVQFYYDYIEQLEDLNDKQFRDVVNAMVNYDETDNVIELDQMCKIAFNFIKKRIDYDKDRYKNICERNKSNGSKGGRPKNPKEPKKPNGLSGNPKEPKKPDIDIDIELDKDIDIDNITTTSTTNNIYSYLETNLGRTLNGAEIELATAWANEYDWEKIEYAIKETLMARANNLKYTDAILRNIKDKSNDELYSKTKEEDEEEIEIPDYDWLNESE